MSSLELLPCKSFMGKQITTYFYTATHHDQKGLGF